MGCDFYWHGSIPESAKQEQAVEFLRGVYRCGSTVHPKPELKFDTVLEKSRGEGSRIPSRSFNCYGFAAHLDMGGYVDGVVHDRDQFIFDRGDGGRLVTIVRDWKDEAAAPWLLSGALAQKYVLRVRDGGWTRVLTRQSSSLAVLLHVLSIRFCLELRVSDDYEVYLDLGAKLRECGLVALLRDEAVDFGGCMKIVADGLGWAKVVDDEPKAAPVPSPSGNDSEVEQPNVPHDAGRPLDFPALSAKIRENVSGRGTTTLGELMMLSEADLLRTRGIGRKSLKLELILEKRGSAITPIVVATPPKCSISLPLLCDDGRSGRGRKPALLRDHLQQ